VNERLLRDEVIGRRRTMGFVVGIDRDAESRLFVVEDRKEIFRTVLVEVHERTAHAEDRVRRSAVGRVHGRNAVKHLENHAVGIEEIHSLGAASRGNDASHKTLTSRRR
jgi:hypothetical protein